MRTIFALTLKFLALVLALFAIFAIMFVLLFLSFNRILLDPQSYKQAFTENKVYDQLPEVTAAEFALIRGHLVEPCTETVIGDSCLDSVVNSSTTETRKLGIEGSALINGLNQDQWNNLVRYLITSEDVQEGLEAAVSEVIAYFKGETDAAGIPLADLNEQLTGITNNELTTMLLNPQPLCTLDQQALIMSAALSNVGSAPIFCSVTGGTSEVLLFDLQRRLDRVAVELPEQVILIKPPSPSNRPGLHRIIGKDLQATLQKLQLNSQYVPLLPVALLVLVTAFGVRSLRGFLRWWGTPIFIGSLLAFTLGVGEYLRSET